MPGAASHCAPFDLVPLRILISFLDFSLQLSSTRSSHNVGLLPCRLRETRAGYRLRYRQRRRRLYVLLGLL